MLDLKDIRNNPEVVRNSLRFRGENPEIVDTLLKCDSDTRLQQAALQALQTELNEKSKALPALKGDAEAFNQARAALRLLSTNLQDARKVVAELLKTREDILLQIPNPVLDGVPQGGEDDFKVLRTLNPARVIPTAKDHAELGLLHGVLDLERGARTSGSRFYYLKAWAVTLERALANLAHDMAEAEGFTPMAPPVLVKPEAMQGTGFLGNHASEVYRLPDDDLYLVGTSEVPLAAYHADEILEGTRRYVATTTCFRREAGAHGRDTRGIFRVHQFQKTELYVFTEPDQAHQEHLRILALEEAFLKALELPYRVIEVAAGDLGLSAARKYDIEVFFPSQDRYREVTSASNCTTFQARRLKVRYRAPKGVDFAATLNGTLAASTRLIAGLLENNQDPHGNITLPDVLAPYMRNTLTYKA